MVYKELTRVYSSSQFEPVVREKGHFQVIVRLHQFERQRADIAWVIVAIRLRNACPIVIGIGKYVHVFSII